MQDNYNISRETIMTHKQEIGKIGEDLAYEYLKSKKYKIIGRNLRQKWGELDIVAKDPAGILVFVEVKTLRCYSEQAMRQNNPAINSGYCQAIAELPEVSQARLKPEDNLTAAKLKKLKRTAGLYAGHNQNLIDEEKGWRIDLIAITLLENQKHQINHYENI